MINFKNLLSRALLALAMVSGSVFAGPSYHIDIATGSFSGNGELELSFNSASTTVPSTAAVRNFSSNFGNVTFSEGVSGNIDSLLTMNTPQSWLVRAVDFGGQFSFDVTFDGPDTGDDGTNFAVSLLQGLDYLAPNVVQIALFPGEAPSVSASDIALVTRIDLPVADVPEPAELALVLTGLGLMGLMRRRRR